MTDLLSCPFCGGKPMLFYNDAWQIHCSECLATTHLSISQLSVVKSWNRRASDARHAEDQATLAEAQAVIAWLTYGLDGGAVLGDLARWQDEHLKHHRARLGAEAVGKKASAS